VICGSVSHWLSVVHFAFGCGQRLRRGIGGIRGSVFHCSFSILRCSFGRSENQQPKAPHVHGHVHIHVSPQSPIRNPQSGIGNPQSPIEKSCAKRTEPSAKESKAPVAVPFFSARKSRVFQLTTAGPGRAVRSTLSTDSGCKRFRGERSVNPLTITVGTRRIPEEALKEICLDR